MKQYRTILVAVGFDERDAVTLRHAARIAALAESETVYITHVASSFDFPAEIAERFPDLVRPVDEDTTDRLRSFVDGQKPGFPAKTRIEYVVREGHPAETLVRLASQKSADLVCLGAAHEGEHALYVSAPAIVRKAPCSVFIVPVGFEPSYKRILLPVDFSESSRAALEQAVTIAASDSGVSLTVLHVYQVPIGASKTGQSYEEVAEVMRAAAEREWSVFSESVDFGGAAWEIRYELSANAPEAISKVAEEIDAQLVVLASHGRTLSAGFLLGHVADCVCSQIKRPVFCVKKKGEVVNLLKALRQLYDFD